MSKRSHDKPSNPEDWDGAGLGLDALRVDDAVRRAFPDLTQFESHRAVTPPQYPYAVLDANTAIARVVALREARALRPDISQAEWEKWVLLLYAGLSEHQRQDRAGLLAAIAAHRPRVVSRSDRRPAGGPAPGDGVTVGRIVDGLRGWSGEWPPSQNNFATTALGVTDRRLRQVLGSADTTWRAVLKKARARR